MSESKIEFKLLEAKLIGNDTITFKLEDGATVKIKVDINRAGVAKNFTNPDGTPHYNVQASLKVNVIPPSKTYSIPKSQLPMVPPKPRGKEPFVA